MKVARLALFLLVQLLALEAAARLFAWWDDGRTLPLSPTGGRHAERVRDLLAEGHAELAYLRHDRDLGWTLKPSFRPRPNEPWELYSTNAAGMRGTAETPLAGRPGLLRVACFGDSYTHGDDVGDADTWPARLAEFSGGSIETLNFGVPGYGPDQALLRLRRDGLPFRPDVVLLAVTDEDASRLLTRFRPFYAFYHFTRDDLVFPKPRFELRDGSLSLVPNPLPYLGDLPEVLDPAFQAAMGARDLFFRENPLCRPPLVARLSALAHVGLALYIRERRRGERHDRLEDEGLALQKAVVAAFAAESAAAGARFGLLLLPERSELEVMKRPNYRSRVRRGMLEYLAGSGIPYLELDAAFAAALGDRPPEALIPGHYSPEGNALVAREAFAWLARWGGR